MRKIIRHPPFVTAISVTLALFLMWPTWTAARNGLSDLYARPAISYLEQKRFGAYGVSEAEWLEIEENIITANELMPNNPRYLESLGWLDQLKLALFADDMSVEQKNAHAADATRHFQQAVESRPTWSYYWGNLVLEHYRHGRYGSEEYSLALANASRFGPWKNDTQRLVLDLGSETWAFLSPSARHEFILNIERGLHRQPKNTIAIVQTYNSWPALCEAAAEKVNITLPHFRALCVQEGYSK